jgi:putative endonuclease
MRRGYVYMLASKRNGTLYIGVTSNLAGRISAHKQGLASAFTKRYDVKSLVWYEEYQPYRRRYSVKPALSAGSGIGKSR